MRRSNTDNCLISGEWEVVPGSGPGRQLGPDEAEWRWNSITQNWERTVVSGDSGASGGKTEKRTFPKLFLPILYYYYAGTVM